MGPTVEEVARLLKEADRTQYEALARSLSADTRKGVKRALAQAKRRLDEADAERERLERLYAFEQRIAREHGANLYVGLDEVGRGCVAGPLAVGAVVLDPDTRIAGLNDSKQIAPPVRERIAAQIREQAVAWHVSYIPADVIDAVGMTASLVKAFRDAVASIEAAGVHPALILLDGNPLHFDEREVSIVKGDAKCASIAAASIVAKVERDHLMCELAKRYPAYHWDECKGYASAAHIAAIRQYGLTPLHRATFCTAWTQQSLF